MTPRPAAHRPPTKSKVGAPAKRRARGSSPSDDQRYAPAVRLAELRSLLASTGGASVYEIAERLRVSVRTALRYLRALERANEPLYDETVGQRKIWRLMASAHRDNVQLTKAQMLALFLSRRVFDFLAGTGFKEDLDEVFARLEATLRKRDVSAGRNLDRKIWDVNEAPHIYEGRLEHVDDIVTALLGEQRLSIRHGSGLSRPKPFKFDPYTLLVYKKGLYLVGFSHYHAGVRTLALDEISEVAWLKGERFDYPADYDPAKVAAGAFGIIAGPTTRVRIRFTQKVARFIRRRLWHPSQRVRRTTGGIELEMEVAGTTELVSWLLSWGDQAELVEPERLREDLARETAAMAALYAGAAPTPCSIRDEGLAPASTRA